MHLLLASAPENSLGRFALWLFLNNKPLGFAAGALALALIWRRDGSFRGADRIAALALAFLCARAAVFLATYDCWDFLVYCDTGRAMLEGTDPYASVMSQYPVHALPLFGLFARLPFRAASALWYAFSLAALVMSIRLAATLARGERHDADALPWCGHPTVFVAVALAGATTWGLDAGQLVAWTTLWIYLAIDALRREKHVAAGLALAAGSLKITTFLPFLLLPFDRRHTRALLVAGAVVAILCAVVAPPSRLLAMQRRHVENVAQARQVGAVNDYTFAGAYHDDLLGLEHWLYCIGLRDARAVSAAQLGLLAVAGLGLLWDFRLRGARRDDRLLSVLLCLYACLFLYHRIYDAVIVALPMAYCLEMARTSPRIRANVYRAIASGLVLVLNFPRGGVLLSFTAWTEQAGAIGRLAQFVLLPYCTWILLASFGLLWYLDRRSLMDVGQPS
ncbi:MAG: glycosyltransferase family 87 protein [Isosphaeraceae bacterium]